MDSYKVHFLFVAGVAVTVTILVHVAGLDLRSRNCYCQSRNNYFGVGNVPWLIQRVCAVQ